MRSPVDDQLAALLGVLPAVFGTAPLPDSATARAALARARAAIGARLLLACARERLVPAALSGMSLKAGPFDLPLRRVRAFELHLPDPDVAPPLPPPGALARALFPALARPTQDRLARELDDGALNLALARLFSDLRERTCSLGQPWPAPLDPENLVVDGHPWHPMSKTRLGLEPAENVEYGPDLHARAPVHAVDVPAEHVATEGPFLELTRALFPPPGPGLLRLPVHALQLRRLPALLGDRWRRLVRPTDLPPLPARALLSLRTVALADHPFHLKLATDLLTTSARRVVSPQSVRNGPQLSALLAAVQAADPLTRRGLRIQPDLAAAGLAAELGPIASQLAVIVRPDPAPLAAELVREDMSSEALPIGHAPEVIVCAALGERRPGGDLLLRELSSTYPGDPRARLAAFLSDYLDLLLPPLLRLWTAHGVALEAHLQNTLLVFAGGRPRGFVARDLGGIRVYRPRLDRPFEFAPGSFTVTDDLAEGQSKLMHVLLHAHLAAVLGWIEDAGGPAAASSWPRVRAGIERLLADWSADPRLARACAEDRARLFAPRCRMKALLAMRIHERSSDYEYTEVANALAGEYPPGAAS